MSIEISVNEASVLLTSGPDVVRIKTSLPCPFVKEFIPSQPNLELRFECSHDTGIQYVKDNFNIEPMVRNIRIQ